MYGPIGYYVTCDDAVCAEHFDPDTDWDGFEDWDEPIAIFDHTESDTPTHCVEDGELIPHTLTSDGVSYVVEALTDVKAIFSTPRDEDGAPLNIGVLEQWADYIEDQGNRAAANVGRALLAMASEPLAPDTGPSAFRLARIADTPSPDTPSSPGAEFLQSVFTDTLERVIDEPDMTYPEDTAHEVADQAVPLYTHAIWATFTDLAAWREDVTDLGPIEDLERGAMSALYMIAHRLASILLEGGDV